MAPAFHCVDGDTIVTETLDAVGVDKDRVARASPPNPTNGPIFVHGAEPRDALCVEILRMTPTRGTGWTNAVLAANVVDPEIARILPGKERATWLIDREKQTARLEDCPKGLEGLILPLQPMIGCFGVAPGGGQAISNAASAGHGGNMDYRGFGPSATVWFPVEVPGALFYLGDCHAIQGDAKLSARESRRPSRSSCVLA